MPLIRFLDYRVTEEWTSFRVIARCFVGGDLYARRFTGEGESPIGAFMSALRPLGVDVVMKDYDECRYFSDEWWRSGEVSTVIVQLQDEYGECDCVWGMGTDASGLDAALKAIVNAVNLLYEIAPPFISYSPLRLKERRAD